MSITELDVVNDCLAAQGESPVNSLTDFNPAIASIRDQLQRKSRAEQARGWWFNKEYITIMPNADGFYYVPNDVLSFAADGTNPGWLSQRGRRLYDNHAGALYTNPKNEPIKLYIVRHVAFDDLPYEAAALIRAATVLSYIDNFDGDLQKLRTASAAYNDARVECNAQHIRAVGANLLSGGGVGQRIMDGRFPTSNRRTS